MRRDRSSSVNPGFHHPPKDKTQKQKSKTSYTLQSEDSKNKNEQMSNNYTFDNNLIFKQLSSLGSANEFSIDSTVEGQNLATKPVQHPTGHNLPKTITIKNNTFRKTRIEQLNLFRGGAIRYRSSKHDKAKAAELFGDDFNSESENEMVFNIYAPDADVGFAYNAEGKKCSYTEIDVTTIWDKDVMLAFRLPLDITEASPLNIYTYYNDVLNTYMDA
jgi:hypothetical protein